MLTMLNRVVPLLLTARTAPDIDDEPAPPLLSGFISPGVVPLPAGFCWVGISVRVRDKWHVRGETTERSLWRMALEQHCGGDLSVQPDEGGQQVDVIL
jgi:hypothetical protein